MIKHKLAVRVALGLILAGGVVITPTVYAVDPTSGLVQEVNASNTVGASTTSLNVGGDDTKSGIFITNSTGTNYSITSDHSLTITNSLPTPPLPQPNINDNFGSIVYAKTTGSGKAEIKVDGDVNFNTNLNAYADLAARGTNSVITITGALIGESTSRGGVLWANEGTINLDSGNLTTTQTVVSGVKTNNLWGAVVSNKGTLNVAGKLTVNSTMDGGRGVQAVNGGTIHLGSYEADVKGSSGMVAMYGTVDVINPGSSASSEIIVDQDVKIKIAGGTAISATGWTGNGSKITIGGNATVENSYEKGYGISSGGMSTTTVKVVGNVDIKTTGTGAAHGVMVSSNGVVEVGSADVKTSGSSAFGINVGSATSEFKVTTGDTAVETTGAGAYAVMVNSGKATVNNAKLTTKGNGFGSSGLAVWNTGSNFTGKNVEINTGGSTAYGIYAYQGVVKTDDLTISTKGNNANGIYAVTSSNLQSGTTSITTGGSTAYGINAETASKVNFGASTIKTSGNSSLGVKANAAEVSMTSSDITTEGGYAPGVLAEATSKVNLGDSIVHTKGASSHGINSKSSEVTATSSNITTDADNAYGVYAQSSSKVDLGANKIVTKGTDSYGVYAQTSEVTMTDSNISTIGNKAYGIYTNRGKVTTGSAVVTTTGNGAYGVNAQNSEITMTNANVTTAGDTAHALRNSGLSTITISAGGNIVANGTNSYALKNIGTGANVPVTDVIGITASAPTSGIVISSDGAGVLNATNSIFMGNVLEKDAASPLATDSFDITFKGSTLTGSTHADTTTSKLNLDMDSASLWNVTANSDLNNFTNNGGTVDMVNSTGGAHETIEVNKLSGTGGNYLMNSDLASETDGDKIIIHSSDVGAGGTVHVYDKSLVTGNEVTGAKKLLMIVDDNKTTEFTGARLHTGGLWDVDPTFERIGNDWYLVKIVKEKNTSTETLLGDLEAGYGLWRGVLTDDTLRKRLGDLRYNETEEGTWARIKAGKQKGSGFYNSYQMYQVGYDRRKDENNAYGLSIEHTRNRSALEAGSGESTMTGLSLYATNYRSKDKFKTYSDIVLRADRLRGDMRSYGDVPDRFDYGTWAFSASYEYGKTYSDKDNKGYFVEPQAQLTWGYMRGGNYVTDYGVKAHKDGIHSLLGRLGVVLGRRIHESDGKKDKSDYYFKANMYREFSGKGGIVLSATNSFGDTENVFHEGYHKSTWYELGLGGNVRVNPKTHVYGDILKTFGGDITTKWQVNAGVRWEF